MEYVFFDTAALVKRYYEEEGTEKVDSIIGDPDTTVIITSLSILETVSAFRRKYNAGDIGEGEMNVLLSEFFREALHDFVILPVGETMHGDAFDRILEDDLRTLDSLQFAAARVSREELDSFRFVSADSDLVEVARKHGMDTINPEVAG
ncbi:MAG: type II toxin-antitoxin system VapC family toxin [Candidatus Nanohaloarchaea archaeon]|nr:type II toxin-antitoxin system VapC family toxin [Candidatus Nanohaloarchaea archaeon]